jgi:hypothetical protein
VVSARRYYGVLAADELGGLFTAQSRSTLETYARLAAGTLDAADAMEDARHQANTVQAPLDLSASLSEIVSTGEMASKVARAGAGRHRLRPGRRVPGRRELAGHRR